MRFEARAVLKRDHFGAVERGVAATEGGAPPLEAVRRLVRAAPWWTRPVARLLARREARVLDRLAPLDGVPRLLGTEPGGGVIRSWIEGRTMQEAAPRDPAYHREARRLVARLHRAGVAHNDLAKEPNWLVTRDGGPALVDLQLAVISRRRGRLFRWMAREDLRHVLKHKRTYCPGALTERERRILATPLPVTRLLRTTLKRAYNIVTRRIFHWTDSEGRGWRRGSGRGRGA